jgi:predicted secreted Zn-dependent protease
MAFAPTEAMQIKIAQQQSLCSLRRETKGTCMVRAIAVFVLVISGGISCVSSAHADMRVNSKVTNYKIAGKTGLDLLNQMDKKGPKHGWLTRAIAQTRYEVTWNIDWETASGRCKPANIDVALDITYSYPGVTSQLSPTMQKRWNAFLKGVKKHEETHATIARRMVTDARKQVSRISVANDRHCGKARAEATKIVSRTYKKYEAQQASFDAVEHADNGNVLKLVYELVR